MPDAENTEHLEERLRETARFLQCLPGVQRVDLLPYHQLGVGKGGGMANNEKGVAAVIWEYSKLTTVPPRPKSAAK